MWQQISQQIFFRELYLIIVKPWSCWQKDYLLLTGPGISPQVYDITPCPAVLISEGVLSYINQVSYNLAMWSSLLHYCTLPKEAFFSSSIWERRGYIWKLNWKESLLIYFENFQGASCSHRQSRNRVINTFIIVNITSICR